MKKLLIAAVLLCCTLGFKQANAQISVNLNLNIDTQPAWGPTGYNNVSYYYFPDIDCYYYVPKQMFIYFNGATWVWAPALPPQYSNFDLYGGYKIVLNGHRPYLQDNVYRVRYASYKGRHGQPVIRDSHDPKYQNHGHRPGDTRPPVNRPNPQQNHPQPAPNHSRSNPAQHHQGGHSPASNPPQNHPQPKPAPGHSQSKPAQNHPQPKQGDKHPDNKKDDHHN